jgi:hypothetical protein
VTSCRRAGQLDATIVIAPSLDIQSDDASNPATCDVDERSLAVALCLRPHTETVRQACAQKIMRCRLLRLLLHRQSIRHHMSATARFVDSRTCASPSECARERRPRSSSPTTLTPGRTPSRNITYVAVLNGSLSGQPITIHTRRNLGQHTSI